MLGCRIPSIEGKRRTMNLKALFLRVAMAFDRSVWLLVIAVLLGCDASDLSTVRSTPNAAAKASASDNCPDVQRFQLTSQGYGIALDTKTGQLCRTFDSSLETMPEKHYPPGTVVFKSATPQHLPLCADLSGGKPERMHWDAKQGKYVADSDK
jgi:hypothetical protein